MYILIYFFTLALSTHAIEFLPCQRALQGSKWTGPDGQVRQIKENHVVVTGKLTDHWETGYEDQTAWSIMDDQIYETLSANGYDALFVLGDGDQVFVLDDKGALKTWGEHQEFTKRGTVTLLGRKIDVAPNRPRFIPAPGQPGLNDEEYREAFERGDLVKAIVRLTERMIKDINPKLNAKLIEFKAHSMNPARLVDVGTNLPSELALFESAFAGKLRVEPDGLTSLVKDDGQLALKFGDKLYLLNEDGQNFATFATHRFPAILEGDELAKVLKARRCVVVRRNL